MLVEVTSHSRISRLTTPNENHGDLFLKTTSFTAEFDEIFS
jgi:hypothetical protein